MIRRDRRSNGSVPGTAWARAAALLARNKVEMLFP